MRLTKNILYDSVFAVAVSTNSICHSQQVLLFMPLLAQIAQDLIKLGHIDTFVLK